MNESQQAFQTRPRDSDEKLFRQAADMRNDINDEINSANKREAGTTPNRVYTTASVDRTKYGYSYRFSNDREDPSVTNRMYRQDAEDPSAEYPDYLKLEFDDINYHPNEPEYEYYEPVSRKQDTGKKIKETLSTLLMGFISGFFILSFMAFFGQMTSVFMLRCALLTVPLRHVKNYRRKYLTPVQSGILATVLFIIGALFA